VTIEELLQLAEECMDRCDLETAYKYAKQALDIDGKSVEALESMAAIQMEMGNSESSKSIYQKLVELSPNEGFSKYMCLAQLSTELEAVEFYKKGIELMIGEYDRQGQQPGTSVGLDGEEEETGVTRLDISTAFGSIAEIYLTDLW
jgi:tetratricopeptide (TPR) repeat protein